MIAHSRERLAPATREYEIDGAAEKLVRGEIDAKEFERVERKFGLDYKAISEELVSSQLRTLPLALGWIFHRLSR